MDVKAINSVSLQQQSFEGKPKRNKDNAEYPQMDSVASKKASKAMRDMAMGLMLLGATAGGMTSCVEEKAWSGAHASADAYAWAAGCNCGVIRDTTVIHDTINNTVHDTIINTEIEPVYLKEFPAAINDSLLRQGLNIGIPLEGPMPDGTSVVFLASKAHNRYDNKFYETKLDSTGTTNDQLALVTKVVDLYDPKNPKTSWIRTLVTDVPGKGIKLDRFTSDSETQPELWQYNYGYSEIRSNGARGGKPGTNTIYDQNGEMIWQGKFEKGQQLGTFLYGTIALDSDNKPYLDENGEPELIHYDYDNAKMWSDKIEYKPITGTASPEDYDFDL